MKRHHTPLALAVLLTLAAAGSALADSTLDVTAAAALEGSFGMEVTLDASGTKAYVQDNTPDSEPIYRVEFLHSRNTMSFDPPVGGNAKRLSIFLGRQTGTPSGTITVFRTMMIHTTNFGYIIRHRVRRDDGGFTHCGDFTLPTSGGVREIGFEWGAATSDGADDGFCRLYRNGNLIYEATGIDNDTIRIDRVQFGATEGNALSNGFGTAYYDSFASFRSVAP